MESLFSKCGMRCDLCLIYRPNVERQDRRKEVCEAWSKMWKDYAPDPDTVICDGCFREDKEAVLFSPACETRKCVMEKELMHCGCCDQYPCAIFPAEPAHEEVVRRVEVEKSWTWEDEKLMEAYACKKNMDGFREKMTDKKETGRISRVDRNLFTVLFAGKEYQAVLRGAFFEAGNERPVVGDFVRFTCNDAGDSRIEEILPRKTVLKRADQSGHAIGYVKTMLEQVMVANFDYVFILASLNDNYNLNRIARYVSVTLEGGGIPVVVLTKADLCPEVKPYCEEVSALSEGVRVHAISNHTGQGLEELQAYFQDGVTIALLGSSGVGKSTLVNKIAGRELMKTSEIREKDGKGRHTTTARQLFVMENGTVLIDTPGMRELGLVDVENGVSGTFSDVEAIVERCRFRNCSHKSEPGCAVRAALSDGALSRERWELYQKMRDESRKNTAMKAVSVRQRQLENFQTRQRKKGK